MILFVGDIHNKIDIFEEVVNSRPEAVAVIQVGDLVPQAPDLEISEFRWRPMRCPVRFIDGNHHHYGETQGLHTATEVCPGLIYCPRGTVEEIDGRRIAFLGGAESVLGTQWRALGVDYWPEHEGIRDEDIKPLLRLGPDAIDILVTHIPPAYVSEQITKHPPTPSSRQVERVWDHLGQPAIVCGHHDGGYDDGTVHVLPFLGWTLR